MKKALLFFVLGMFLSSCSLFAEDVSQSTAPAKAEPKLLWEKAFDMDILSYSMMFDGSYMAVSTYFYDSPNKKHKRNLLLLDSNGNIIWKKNGSGGG